MRPRPHMVMCATFVTMKQTRETSVPAGEFKAKCLSLFDEVEARRKSFVITKRGRPVARIVPLTSTTRSLHGSLVHEEDLLAPIDVPWDAQT